MNKILIFIFVVLVGLFITFLTLLFFRPESFEGISGNTIGITLSAMSVLSYFILLITEKKWMRWVFYILMAVFVLIVIMAKLGLLANIINPKPSPKPPKTIIQQIPHENEKTINQITTRTYSVTVE